MVYTFGWKLTFSHPSSPDNSFLLSSHHPRAPPPFPPPPLHPSNNPPPHSPRSTLLPTPPISTSPSALLNHLISRVSCCHLPTLTPPPPHSCLLPSPPLPPYPLPPLCLLPPSQSTGCPILVGSSTATPSSSLTVTSFGHCNVLACLNELWKQYDSRKKIWNCEHNSPFKRWRRRGERERQIDRQIVQRV